MTVWFLFLGLVGAGEPAPGYFHRHCEERSDDAIQSFRWIASLRSQ
jgi:hypothetical protein